MTESRRGGSQSITRPLMSTRPSGIRMMKLPPTLASISTVRPKKYCLANSALVSASHTFSGVAAM